MITHDARGFEGYVASADVIDDHLAEETTTTDYVKVAEFEIISRLAASAELRFKVDINCWNGQRCYADFRYNGVSWFIKSQDVAGYTTHTEDKTYDWLEGDLISVWIKSADTNGLVKNIKLCGIQKPLVEI